MVVGVLVELSSKNIDKIFDYNVPEDLVSNMKIGIRVTVPFGRMTLEGFVLDIKKNNDSDIELKSIISIVDNDIVLNDELLNLGKVMRDKTLSTSVFIDEKYFSILLISVAILVLGSIKRVFILFQ